MPGACGEMGKPLLLLKTGRRDFVATSMSAVGAQSRQSGHGPTGAYQSRFMSTRPKRPPYQTQIEVDKKSRQPCQVFPVLTTHSFSATGSGHLSSSRCTRSSGSSNRGRLWL